jgi:hypothetical protein
MEKINLYINSKNKSSDENNNSLKICLPSGFICCKADEYFVLNVNSFHTYATWYNCNASNNTCKLISKSLDGTVYQTFNFELPIGNPNVMNIERALTFALLGFVKISYDSIRNIFQFSRDQTLSSIHHTIYISPINCGQFLGLKNNVEIEITTFGVDSEYKVNVITLRAINIKVNGDIDLVNGTLDNFTSSSFQHNDIIFNHVVDTKFYNCLGYNNHDASNNFNYVLSNNNSGQINNFTLKILDQDLNPIEDMEDFTLHLQFIKTKKQTPEMTLFKLLDYVKDIFLMIGNFLYPSRTNSIIESNIYIPTPKMFSKYRNPV